MSGQSERRNVMEEFKDCKTISLFDFIKIWKTYDTDRSGFIEATPDREGRSEFREFVSDLMEVMLGKKPSEREINNTSSAFLKQFDTNKDKRFAIHEMMHMLPVERNFLQQFLGGNITEYDVDIIFEHYDKDNSGTIQRSEVKSIVNDLMTKKLEDKSKKKQLESEISQREEELLALLDKDGDGCICKEEIIKLFKMYFTF